MSTALLRLRLSAVLAAALLSLAGIDAVRAYNTALRTFPTVIWAKTAFAGEKPMAEFTANEGAATPPQVKF